ncbi:hypothetical protein F66182_7350 [Fusarium sp. NRRL 66182]|nr:hypothetical protein F66182_7350 [Fusarium sp. NRRL 66182]
MKYSLAFAALVAAVQAQTLADVPECAIPCLDDAIASETNCETTDLACVCQNFNDVRSAATSCVIDECGSDVAINEVLPATEGLCENPEAGAGSEGSTTAAASTRAESTTAAAQTSAAAETSADDETTTVPPVVESTTSVVPPVISTPSASPSGDDDDGAASTPAPAPTNVEQSGAAGLKSIGAIAMAALAVFAL